MAIYSARQHTEFRRYIGTLRSQIDPTAFAFDNSIYPACSFNLGPCAISGTHADTANKAGSWCSITSGGSYDPKLGGHLVLWELGLIIEFPPGSTIDIPSSLVTHSNTTIQEGETRVSFTQYAAGALFRWVDQGCRTEKRLREEDEAGFRRLREGDCSRFSLALGLYTKLDELGELLQRTII